jgi:hypothetical protein
VLESRAMSAKTPASSVARVRLIAVPVLISLAVTLLRLTGELNHWSERWFSRDTGGIQPSGMSWLVGISWLPVPLGIYFAIRLIANGQGPSGKLRPVIFAILGVLTAALFLYVIIPKIPMSFPPILIFVWAGLAIAGILQWFGWPALFKTLLAYAVASRAIVALIMFLAMRGNWGTHYDYYGMPAEFQMNLLPRYLWLAFFPQLVFWVGNTVVLGALAGGIAAAVSNRRPENTRGHVETTA